MLVSSLRHSVLVKTLIGSFELNINMCSNVFNSLQPLITIKSLACPKQLFNLQANYWKNLLNVSSLDIIWFSLTTRELFSSLALNKSIRGLFRTLQTFKMERLAKVVNNWKLLSIFTKSSILHVWKGSKSFIWLA